ncbi:acyl carrier protein [Fodinicola acaciae]|uniref:acyl carrier protein n=1 Tax=Fodinicola acaciae TaxID=2681555 RepID=UPI0013D5C83E|nr:acyl carrier protein [Fodinicola acaciae]
MTREELSSIVRTKVAEVVGVELDEITERTALDTDYGVDSLELLEIGARVEKAVNVRIGVGDLIKAETVGHAVDLLAERLLVAGPAA